MGHPSCTQALLPLQKVSLWDWGDPQSIPSAIRLTSSVVSRKQLAAPVPHTASFWVAWRFARIILRLTESLNALTKHIQVFASEPHSTWPYRERHHPPCSRSSLQQPQQWRLGTSSRGLTVPYFPHNVVKFLLEVWMWHFTDQSFYPTLPAHPHSVFRYATPIQHPLPPPDPAHHQANVAIRCSLVLGIYGSSSNDTITKSIIGLWSRMSDVYRVLLCKQSWGPLLFKVFQAEFFCLFVFFFELILYNLYVWCNNMVSNIL